MNYKDPCHDCGCERIQHYLDPIENKRYCCTSLHCECRMFWDGKGLRPELREVPKDESTVPIPQQPWIGWP